MHLLYYFGWIVSRVFYFVVFRARVRGREHIPDRGPFILATNHISYFDPPFVGSSVRRAVYFLAKAELFRPGMRRFFFAIHALPVRRGAVDRNALRLCSEKLGQGYGLVVFPEGTHSPSGKMLPARPGLGLIALNARCPIIPGYVEGANHLWDCLLGRRRLSISFGPAMTIEEIAAFPMNKRGYQALSDEALRRVRAVRDAAKSD